MYNEVNDIYALTLPMQGVFQNSVILTAIQEATPCNNKFVYTPKKVFLVCTYIGKAWLRGDAIILR